MTANTKRELNNQDRDLLVTIIFLGWWIIRLIRVNFIDYHHIWPFIVILGFKDGQKVKQFSSIHGVIIHLNFLNFILNHTIQDILDVLTYGILFVRIVVGMTVAVKKYYLFLLGGYK